MNGQLVLLLSNYVLLQTLNQLPPFHCYVLAFFSSCRYSYLYVLTCSKSSIDFINVVHSFPLKKSWNHFLFLFSYLMLKKSQIEIKVNEIAKNNVTTHFKIPQSVSIDSFHQKVVQKESWRNRIRVTHSFNVLDLSIFPVLLKWLFIASSCPTRLFEVLSLVCLARYMSARFNINNLTNKLQKIVHLFVNPKLTVHLCYTQKN